MEGKWKIAGVTIAVIIVASMLTVMVPMVSASPAGAEHKVPATQLDGKTIYVGEILNITNLEYAARDSVSFRQTADPHHTFTISVTDVGTPATNDDDYARKEITDADVSGYTGEYEVTWADSTGTHTSTVYIQKPTLAIKIKDEKGIKEITSTTKGTNITICADTNMPGDFEVKINRKNPSGYIYKQKVNLSELISGKIIDTSGWKTGEHELWIETVPELSYGLDMKSDTVTIRIYEEEISIEAEKTEPFTYEKVKITVRAPPYTLFNFSTNYPENVIMTSAEDNPLNLSIGEETNMTNLSNPKIIKYNGRYGFNATTDESGEYAFVVKFTDDRTYTFKVWFGYDSYDDATGKHRAKVDIDVSEAKITFDVPATVVRGETLTIRGTAPEAKWVVIAVDDKVIEGGEHVTVTNGEFEVDWDTSNYVTGTHMIEGFIELKGYKAGDSVKGISSDGHTSIRIISKGLTAEQPRNVVALGDDYTIKGTATGVDYVDIIIIGPKGCTGTPNLNDTDESLRNGLYYKRGSVTDNEFEEDITCLLYTSPSPRD